MTNFYKYLKLEIMVEINIQEDIITDITNINKSN